ncbi:DUF2894 domain-containing protein [Paraburkholderia sp. 2C]|jgi:DUF2894 family protein
MSDVRETPQLPQAAFDDGGRGDARATLDAWRAAGADRIDPLRFAALDALARRIAQLSSEEGEFGRLLDARLAALMTAYAEDIERNRREAELQPPPADNANAQRGTTLAALTASLKSGRTERAETLADTLQYFHATWSKLSAGRQLRESLAQVPGNAGPLNSNRLVHRALSLMNELSPDYLQQFLSYVETLSALGDLAGGGSGHAGAEASGADGTQPPRGKNAKGAKPVVRRKPKAS